MSFSSVMVSLVEVAAIFVGLVLAPTAILTLAAKVFGRRRAPALRSFIRKQLGGMLVGIAVSASFVALVGKSSDETILDFFRRSIDIVLTAAGADQISICRRRLESTYKFTCDGFVNEAISFNSTSVMTLEERSSLLAVGNLRLLFPLQEDQTDSCALYRNSISQYCSEQAGKK